MPQESPTDYSALFDDGGDPYAALFDGEPVQPTPPTDEGGGGDVGPPTQFPEHPIDPALRQPAAMRRELAKQEGQEDAIPFLRNLEAAMAAGVTDQTYGEAKAASMRRRDALREEFPAEYWTRNVPTSIGAGYLTSRAGVAAEALGNLGQAENYGDATALDAALPFAIGGAVSGGLRVGGMLVRALGKTLQVPLAAAERLVQVYGPRRVFEMLRGADNSEAGRLIAQRVEALKGNIDAAENFVPAEVPKIRPETPDDWRALELADQAERGKAQILQGDDVFYGDPSLEGDAYDDALRDAMRKNVPDFEEGADLLGEFERVKYPERAKSAQLATELPESMKSAGAEVPTKNAVAPAAEGVPSGAGSFKSNREAWNAITEASGVDDFNQSRAAGHFDEVERIIGRKVRDAKDAFDGLVKMSAAKRGRSRPPYDWEDVQTAVRVLRDVEGLERLKLPSEIQERLIPLEREASEVSFNPSKLDSELAADAAAEREAMNIKHKGEFRGPTGRAKDKPRLVEVPPDGEGSFADDYGLKPADESQLVSGVHQRRVRLDDSALEEGVREESELSREYFDRMDRSASVPAGVKTEGMTSVQRAEMLNAVKRDTAAGVRQRRAALVTKAREYRTLMAQADAIESQNRMAADQLRGKADKARAELASIMNEQKKADDAAKAVADRVSYSVPLTAVAAGVAGRKLTAWAAANAERWATGSGELGRLARWALSGSGAGQELRMFMLARAAQESGESD